MKPVKIVIAVLGVVGAVAVFLPYMSMGEESVSFWKLTKLADVAVQAYLALAGFILAAAMGAMAMAKGGMRRSQAIVATVGFALCLIPEGVREGFDANAIGGKLLLICAALGLLAGIVGIAKPEQG